SRREPLTPDRGEHARWTGRAPPPGGEGIAASWENIGPCFPRPSAAAAPGGTAPPSRTRAARPRPAAGRGPQAARRDSRQAVAPARGRGVVLERRGGGLPAARAGPA